MRRKALIVAAVFCAILVIAAVWYRLPTPDPYFRGKPESEWIHNLKYWDDEQAKLWRTFGPEGVHVLMRGMKNANRPIERTYRHFYRNHLGQMMFMARFLPAPKPDSTRSTRMCILSLLSELGTNADDALPVLESALDEEDQSVVGSALGYFSDTEGEDGRLNRISKADKNRLLPKFVHCMSSADWSVRNNALGCLYYYPEQKQTVGPIIVNALADTQPHVQIRAAEALKHVDPQLFKSAGAVHVPIQILKNPDDQIAYRGADLLRKCNDQPDLALQPLIEALRSTNTLVACSAVWALDNFTDHSAVILPPLREATLRKDNAANYAKRTVKKLEAIEAKRKL